MSDFLLPKALLCLTTSELTQIQKELEKNNSAKGAKLLKLFKYIRKNGAELNKKSRSEGAQLLQNYKLRNTLLDILNQQITKNYLNQSKIESSRILTNIWSEKIGDELLLSDQPKEYALTLYEHYLNQWGNEIADMTEGIDQYHNQFLHIKHQFESPYTNREKEGLPLLQQMENALDLEYTIQKLRIACDRILQSKFLQNKPGEADVQLISMAMKMAPNSPLIQLYLSVYQLLQTSEISPAKLNDTICQLRNEAKQIDAKQRHILLRYLTNCCTGQYMTSGNQQFLELKVEAEMWDAQQIVSFQKNTLPDSHFLNIITGLTILKKFAEARQFIQNYSPKLVPRYRKTATHLAKAYLDFHQGNFAQAKQELEEVSTQQPRFLLRKRSLLLRNTFELMLSPGGSAVYDDVETQIVVFTKFLERDTYHLSKERIESYKNHIEIVKALNRFYEKGGNAAEFEAQILEQLQSEKVFVPQWLKAKLAQVI